MQLDRLRRRTLTSTAADALARDLVEVHARGGLGTAVTWLNHWSAQRVHASEAGCRATRTLSIVGIDGLFLGRLLGREAPRTSADLVIPRLLPALENARVAVIGADADANLAACRVIDESLPASSTVVAGLDGFEDLAAMRQDLQAWLLRVQPTVVILGLGSPLQEIVAAEMLRTSLVPLTITCGGFLDQVSQSAYYPAWAYPLKLNWAIRLAREPRRLWRRYTVDAVSARWRKLKLMDFVLTLPGYFAYEGVVAFEAPTLALVVETAAPATVRQPVELRATA